MTLILRKRRHQGLKDFMDVVLITLVLTASLMTSLPKAQAQVKGCQGHYFNPVKDLDVTGFLPMTVGNQVLHAGRLPDTPPPKSPTCYNPHTLHGGVNVGFWVPVMLVDVTRHPYCLVSLGGKTLPLSQKQKKKRVGDISHSSSRNNQSFYYVHTYQLPTATWFPKLFGAGCSGSKFFGLTYVSELDPTWTKDTLTPSERMQLLPVLKNIAKVQALNAVDCIAATTKLPLDKITWNLGCQGSLYPLNGRVSAVVDSVQASVLMAERATAKLVQLESLNDNMQPKKNTPPAHFQKSHYRYQLIYPKRKKIQPFGRSTAPWAAGVVKPNSSEEYSVLIWEKKTCCVT